MEQKNVGVILKRIPDGLPTIDDFDVIELPMPKVDTGEILVQNQWLSLDPYMRGQISGRHLNGSVAPGQLMLGETIAQIISSDTPEFTKGESVRGMLGWQLFTAAKGEQLSLVPKNIPQASYCLSILGMPGLTAFAGLIWKAKPKPDNTVVVSSASGAVGSLVVQLAKREGCRVVGIAGSDEKCQFVTEKLGADFCINRKTQNLEAALYKLCPEGIDIYFDLVGGETLVTISKQLAIGARVILCGLSSDYNRIDDSPPAGPSPASWILARAHVHGLVVYDYEHRRNEFLEFCAPLVNTGELIIKEHVVDGLKNAPQGFVDLMSGKNLGKVVVKV